MATNLTENVNLFQPTGFRLIIDRKNYANLEFFAQSVSHPSTTLQAVEVPFQRIQGVPFAGDAISYGELTINILMDEDFNAYTEMFNWMKRLLVTNQVNARESMDKGILSTETDITVVAMSSHNNANKSIVYKSALPVSIGDINFEATNQSVEFITFPVTFRFTEFEIKTI
jgi:hypothetical protein